MALPPRKGVGYDWGFAIGPSSVLAPNRLKPRRLLAALLAAYTVVVVSGAPLPLSSVVAWTLPAVEDTERFPCEACPCGCGTAEHCWNACCCHTLAQRISWAKSEGVRPPETALDDAERAGLDIREWRPMARYQVRCEKPGSAPAEQALPPCCRQRLACCDSQPTCETPASQPEDQSPNERPTPGVALLKAMACQGLAEAWMQLGHAPIPPAAEVVTTEVTVYATPAPAPLWCRPGDAPTPPPPDGLGFSLS